MLHSPQSIFPPDHAMRLINAARCHFGPEYNQLRGGGEPSPYHSLLFPSQSSDRSFPIIQPSQQNPHPAFQHPHIVVSAMGSSGSFQPSGPPHLSMQGRAGIPPSLESYSQTLINLSHQTNVIPGSLPHGMFPPRGVNYGTPRLPRSSTDQSEYSAESAKSRSFNAIQGQQNSNLSSPGRQRPPLRSPNGGITPDQPARSTPTPSDYYKLISNNNNNNPSKVSAESSDKIGDNIAGIDGPISSYRNKISPGSQPNKSEEFWRPQQQKDLKSSINALRDSSYLGASPLNNSIFRHLASAASQSSAISQKGLPYPPHMFCPPLFSTHNIPSGLPISAGTYRPQSPPIRRSEDEEKDGNFSPEPPAHFTKGSLIQLANGELKRVEDLRTDDFVRSADISPKLSIDSSRLIHMRQNHDKGAAVLAFSVGKQQLQVTVEATLEHPFFVYGRGWASGQPSKTLERYGLECSQLTVGDVCISLVQSHSQASATSRPLWSGSEGSQSDAARSEARRRTGSPIDVESARRSGSNLGRGSTSPSSAVGVDISGRFEDQRFLNQPPEERDQPTEKGFRRIEVKPFDENELSAKCCRKLKFDDYSPRSGHSLEDSKLNISSPNSDSFERSRKIPGHEESHRSTSRSVKNKARNQDVSVHETLYSPSPREEGNNTIAQENSVTTHEDNSTGSRKRRWSAPSDHNSDD